VFAAQVDIVSAGDFVNELHLILAGHAAAERGNAGDTQLASDGTTSIHGASLRLLGPGEPAGEMAFFTETPAMEVCGGVWCVVCANGCAGGLGCCSGSFTAEC
jgi:hypothetical protein